MCILHYAFRFAIVHPTPTTGHDTTCCVHMYTITVSSEKTWCKNRLGDSSWQLRICGSLESEASMQVSLSKNEPFEARF